MHLSRKYPRTRMCVFNVNDSAGTGSQFFGFKGWKCKIKHIGFLVIFRMGSDLDPELVWGDPNQNLKLLLAIIQKLCISDPMLVKPKCIWEANIYFDFSAVCLQSSK